jgi:hypothetical protein
LFKNKLNIKLIKTFDGLRLSLFGFSLLQQVTKALSWTLQLLGKHAKAHSTSELFSDVSIFY